MAASSNPQSSSAELLHDPQPGPSTSAAEFDLEVFDSGSSCSMEDGWGVPISGVKRRCQEERRFIDKSGSSLKNVQLYNDQQVEVSLNELISSKSPNLCSLPQSSKSFTTVDHSTLSCTDGNGMSINSDIRDEEDWSGDDEPPIMELSGPVLSPGYVDSSDADSMLQCNEVYEMSAAVKHNLGQEAVSRWKCDNSDEIVRDHDNFGTDENDESSLDFSVCSFRQPSPLSETKFVFKEAELNTVGTTSQSFVPMYKSLGTSPISCVKCDTSTTNVISFKRKSDDGGFVPSIKQEESLQRPIASIPLKKRCRQVLPDSFSRPIKRPVGYKSLIPDRENPPHEILDWVAGFSRWSHAERLLAIDKLIESCEPTQVRHMMQVIEPQFQRDFISLLPKELSLYVLCFLHPRDLLRAAQTCRYWRILAEDNLLWREKCREIGIEDVKEIMNRRRKQPTGFNYSPWKGGFMRQHNIEMNWRSQEIRTPKVLKGHDDHVITCLQFHSNRIVSGSDDNTLKVWSATNGKCLRTLIGHTGGVWSSQMNGNVIVSGSTDRTLKVWEADSGICKHTLYGHTSTVRCMHLHQQRVVSGSRDATLRVWDIGTGECLHVLVGHVAAVRCVQYDGRLVVSGAYDYMVKVWNPELEECLHTLSGHTNRVYSLQFDGRHVVSGSLDTSIRVWDVESGACRHALMGHQSLTSGMELRNNILVSGNADSTVKVWDITNGQCLQTLSGPNKHQSAVTCLQFNSKFVITSSDDGTVKLWDVKTGEFVRDLVALDSGGSGGVVWRIRASATKLVCAVGSRNGTEETKLMVLDFDAVPSLVTDATKS